MSLFQGKTVHNRVQAWLHDITWNTEDFRDKSNFTVNLQRPRTISRRIERAVNMNLTDRWSDYVLITSVLKQNL